MGSSLQIKMFKMAVWQEEVVGKQSSDQGVLDDFCRKEWLGSSLQIKMAVVHKGIVGFSTMSRSR